MIMEFVLDLERPYKNYLLSLYYIPFKLFQTSYHKYRPLQILPFDVNKIRLRRKVSYNSQSNSYGFIGLPAETIKAITGRGQWGGSLSF